MRAISFSLPFFGTITLIGWGLASFTERLSPPNTLAKPTCWLAANSVRVSKLRKPHSSIFLASEARSSGSSSPLITTISRVSFCTAEPTMP